MAQAPKPLQGPGSSYEAARRKANENVVMIMGSGRLNGYTQFAEDISNVLDSLPDANLRVIPVLGKSAGQNILDMLYLKGADMGVVDQDILSYLKRTDPRTFGDIDQRIQYVTKLFNSELHLYAKKDIRGLEDLRGKKISCLKAMSTVALFCENLFFPRHQGGNRLRRRSARNGEGEERPNRGCRQGRSATLQGFENVTPKTSALCADRSGACRQQFDAVRPPICRPPKTRALSGDDTGSEKSRRSRPASCLRSMLGRPPPNAFSVCPHSSICFSTTLINLRKLRVTLAGPT